MKSSPGLHNRKKRNRAITSTLCCLTALVFPLSSSALAGLAIDPNGESTGLVMSMNLALVGNPGTNLATATIAPGQGTISAPEAHATGNLSNTSSLLISTGSVNLSGVPSGFVGTTVTAGTLLLNSGAQFGNTTVTGGTLVINSGVQIGNTSLTGVPGPGTLTLTGTNTIGGVTIGGTTPSTTDSLLISTGSVNLSGVPSGFVGTTVTSGTLLLNSGAQFGNTTVTGGTLVINSGVQIGNTTLTGVPGPGTLTLTGTNTIGSVTIGGTTPSITSSLQLSTGSLNLSGVSPTANIKVTSGTLVINDSGDLNLVRTTLSTNPATKGNYQGLLTNPGSTNPLPFNATPSSAGRVTVSVAAKGAVSGSLDYAGLTYRFSGILGSNVVYQRTFTTVGKETVKLKLQWKPAASTIEAVVTGGKFGTDVVSQGTLAFIEFNAKTNPAPQAGKYTLTSHSPSDDGATNGYAATTVSPAGIATFVGKLKDGQPSSSTSMVLKDGACVLYLPTNNTGQLAGVVDFEKNGAYGSVSGRLEEYTQGRPSASGLMLPGSVESIEVDGELYTEPKAGSRVIDLDPSSGKLTLNVQYATKGSAPRILTKQLTLNAENLLKVVGSNLERVRFGFATKTGILSGSFYDPKGGLTWRLEGIVLQDSGLFEGVVLGNGDFGSWKVSLPAQD